MNMQLSEVAQALAAPEPVDVGQVTVTSVGFDSRQLTAGALFIPLIGEHDGHAYVAAAKQAGAVATLWQADHGPVPADLPAIVVPDTLAALQRLARYYLERVNPRVVAVTGSNGKTTTKDMIAAVLGTTFTVHKTNANFNNEIGVPVTVLGMDERTEVLVVEMGMDRSGQLDALSKLVSPDVAVITMIGEAHIEFFGTRERIADAKMEITHGLKADGTLVYNGDEPLLRARTADLAQDVRTFGTQKGDDLVARKITGDATTTTFTASAWPDEPMTVNMIGTYNVMNALAALSVGQLFKVPAADMREALGTFALTANRTEWRVAPSGMRILSDVYNSNPTAAREVLAAFTKAPTDGRRIVVLGDMLELGEQGAAMHAALADALDPRKIQQVYLCGDLMKNLAAALADRYGKDQVHWYPLAQQPVLISDLLSTVQADDIVLLKGSHGMHLEKVLAALTTPSVG